MIIYLFGPDSYRRQQKVKEIIAAYRQKHPNFDFASFDLFENTDDYLALKDFLNQQSLFEDFKLVLVSGIFKVDAKKLKPILKNQLTKENSALVVTEVEESTKEFDFLLQKPVHYQEFEKLNTEKLGFFIRKEAEKRNLKFEPEAKKYLIRWQKHTDSDTGALINELDKITLAGFPQPITISHLESLIPFSEREKIFDLARILAGQNSLKKKLVALERILIQKEPAAYVFNLLSYQAPVPLLLKLADYDVSVKSGGLDYEEVLLDLVLTNN